MFQITDKNSIWIATNAPEIFTLIDHYYILVCSLPCLYRTLSSHGFIFIHQRTRPFYIIIVLNTFFHKLSNPFLIFYFFIGLQSLWITSFCSSQLQQKSNNNSHLPRLPLPLQPPTTSQSSEKLLQTPCSDKGNYNQAVLPL